jgi:transcription initiation factor TFIIIB Brf1 subunit/transcription initiation factor TFIIB
MPKKIPAQTEKPKRGRPFKEINIELLKRMAARHSTMEEMADCLGITSETLRNNYLEVITEARGRGKLELRDLQWRIAEKGSADMAKWLGRAILKQNESSTALNEDQTSALSEFTDSIDRAREADQS